MYPERPTNIFPRGGWTYTRQFAIRRYYIKIEFSLQVMRAKLAKTSRQTFATAGVTELHPK
jgi:hypothetical protein